jgi:phage terminase small subunit
MPRPGPAAYIRPVVGSLPQRLKPPDNLSAGARAVFLQVVTAERPEHFRQSDLALLIQYCEAAVLAERAIEKLQRDNAAPRWLDVWQAALKAMKDLAMRLRLSPQSRQPNNPTRPQRMSYYQRAALAEGDGDEE